MTYREALAFVDQLQFFSIKLGLEATADLLASLGNPHAGLRLVHIAGTNGKGSVGATLLSLLTEAGYRVGFYSSPHLVSVRERFRLGGRLIAPDAFTAIASRLKDHLADRRITYFEFTTVLALLWFAEEQVDLAILETGMGGRLDATNVITPLLSIITDISRDHEQYLGSDLATIAGEKAGIIKPCVPVVFSGRVPEALPVIDLRCQETASPLFVQNIHFRCRLDGNGRLDYDPIEGAPWNNLPLMLAGAHQAVNASLALAALELLGARGFSWNREHLVNGMAKVRWPGRLERIDLPLAHGPVTVLLDGAHNQAGVEALHQALVDGFPRSRLLLVWGNMRDKDLLPDLIHLIGLADQVFFTRIDSVRAQLPDVLLAQLPEHCRDKSRIASTVQEALDMVSQAALPGDLICVAGSLHLVGKVRELLLGHPDQGSV